MVKTKLKINGIIMDRAKVIRGVLFLNDIPMKTFRPSKKNEPLYLSKGWHKSNFKILVDYKKIYYMLRRPGLSKTIKKNIIIKVNNELDINELDKIKNEKSFIK